MDPLVGLFYRCLGVLCGLVVLLFFLKPQQLRAVDARSVALLLTGGFIASVVAQMTFYRSLKLGDVSSVVPLSGSYPLIAFVLGVLVLGESVTVIKLFGVLLVVAGIWVLNAG